MTKVKTDRGDIEISICRGEGKEKYVEIARPSTGESITFSVTEYPAFEKAMMNLAGFLLAMDFVDPKDLD